MHNLSDEPLDVLLQRLQPDRIQRLRTAAQQRMAGLTVVLESLYDPGNRAAVFRTAEAFGLDAVHVIDRKAGQKHGARLVSRGTEKWLQMHDHATTDDALLHLRSRGYRLYAADLDATRPLEALDFSPRVALVFGNEHRGISDALRESADERFRIPMVGFAESLNISAAAAITIHTARRQRERALGRSTDLSAAEQHERFDAWVRETVRWMPAPK
jgi:tRNA (guanosine-2'-O-)-methyltransferase